MYKLAQIKIKDLDYLDIENASGSSKLRICVNQGGRIAQLKFNTVKVIPEIDPSTYKDNYASALLFPFANRIKDGQYTFKESVYKLDCNEIINNNAIHGLIYNKPFEFENSNL